MILQLLFIALMVAVYAGFEALSENAQLGLRSGPVPNEKTLQGLWHKADAGQRCYVFTLCFWLFTFDFLLTGLYTGYALAIYWLLFDMLLNQLRDKPLFYVGQTSEMDRGLRYIAVSINVPAGLISVLVKVVLIGIFAGLILVV